MENLTKDFGEQGAYRLTSVNEMQNGGTVAGTNLFSDKDDFINLLEVARDYPNINEVPLQNRDELLAILNKINSTEKAIPLFVKRVETSEFDVILAGAQQMDVHEGDQLIYLGKEVNVSA